MKVTTSDGRVLLRVNRVKAWALMIWGPADSWDNPLCGTRYDPVVRQLVEHDRWVAREQRRDVRKAAHAPR